MAIMIIINYNDNYNYCYNDNYNGSTNDVDNYKCAGVESSTGSNNTGKSDQLEIITIDVILFLANTHNALRAAFKNMIKDARMVQFRSFILPISNETDMPKKVQTKTHFPIHYMTLISVVSECIYKQLNRGILPEQNGCVRNLNGCKYRLLVNKTKIEDWKKTEVIWEDYRKAYDNVQTVGV